MSRPAPEFRAQFLPAVLTAAAVCLAALGGIALTAHTGRVASVWLANAVVVLVLLRRPVRTWPLWLACGFAGNLAANLVAGDGLPMAAYLSLCNLVEILAAGWLTRRFCGGPAVDLRRGDALVRFALLGGGLAPAASALLAALALGGDPGPSFWTVAETWFSADALGLLILVPLGHRLTGARLVQACRDHRLAVLLGLAAGLGSGLLVTGGHLAWLFLLSPLFMATVFRAGFLGGSAALCLAALSGLAALAFRTGASAAQFRAQIEYLQVFIVTNVLVCLPAASLLAERRRAHEAAAASQALLGGTIDAASDYIWSVDPVRFGLLTFNASLKRDHLRERNLELQPGLEPDDLYPVRAYADWWRRTYREALERGSFQTEYELSTGSRILSLNLNVVGPAGAPRCIAVFARDVTALRRGEQTIRNLNERLEARVAERTAELEAFTYSVAHDLRTPLRAVDGFAQVLLEDHGAALDAEGRRLLGRVRHGAQRMGHLIDDLLSLSRVSRGTLDRRPHDLSELAGKFLAELARTHPERSVRVIVEPGVRVVGDGRLLAIALHSLLDNAWKFTLRAGDAEIRFGGRVEDGGTSVFVQDNGEGFDMTYAGKLFEPFQRLHAAPEFEGNGIGLALVRRIIRRHGGTVRAQAEPGRGATFGFTLPGVPEAG